MLDGRIINLDEIWQINIWEIKRADQPSTQSLVQRLLARLGLSRPAKVADVTERLLGGPPSSNSMEASGDINCDKPATDAKEVFVVHGRNEEARDTLFEFLRAIGLHPLEWSEAVQATGKASPYIGEILKTVFSRAHAVIVLFTPDDKVKLRQSLWADNEPPNETELTGQPRPNVLFEAGMAMAGSEERTILVELGTLRGFSDIDGRHRILLNNSPERRRHLAERLENAGCPVRWDEADWKSTGDFEAAVAERMHEPTSITPDRPSAPIATLPQSQEARTLLIEAASGDGYILKVPAFGGLTIEANDKSFVKSGNLRSEALWTAVLTTLADDGFIEGTDSEGQVFKLTHKGFDYVDSEAM